MVFVAEQNIVSKCLSPGSFERIRKLRYRPFRTTVRMLMWFHY